MTEIYDDDTFLVSYPRSGNTWMRYLISSIKEPQKIWNLLTISEIVPDIYEKDISTYKKPRIIKSHELYREEYPKVIYLFRDGRDVALSYFHFYQTIHGYNGNFRDFLIAMLTGNVFFGSWHAHIESWMFRDYTTPFMPIQYESLYESTFKVLQEVSAFLGLKTDENTITTAITNSSFEKQQEDVKNLSPHYVKGFRCGVKGGPGNWKKFFDESLLDLFWEFAGQTMEKLGYSRNISKSRVELRNSKEKHE